MPAAATVPPFHGPPCLPSIVLWSRQTPFSRPIGDRSRGGLPANRRIYPPEDFFGAVGAFPVEVADQRREDAYVADLAGAPAATPITGKSAAATTVHAMKTKLTDRATIAVMTTLIAAVMVATPQGQSPLFPFAAGGGQPAWAASRYGILGRLAPEPGLDTWIDGQGRPMAPVHLRAYRGKVVVLYFFQDW